LGITLKKEVVFSVAGCMPISSKVKVLEEWKVFGGFV
jgi:hypothetical protein